jgi:hypothetical protein
VELGLPIELNFFIPDSSLGIVLPHQIATQKGEGNFDGINLELRRDFGFHRNIFAFLMQEMGLIHGQRAFCKLKIAE